ncbi:MAG: polyprenol monophosphomannose synthase, partial [Candidatus Delongbacteria bacterium]|nr:polyprenol monophosphomannose synthase [Candidatus Delongbacteria bacterium]
RSNGYSFQIEMHFKAWKNKFRIKEIPIIFTDRIDGHSKMGKDIVKEAVFMVWKLRFPFLAKKLKSNRTK